MWRILTPSLKRESANEIWQLLQAPKFSVNNNFNFALFLTNFALFLTQSYFASEDFEYSAVAWTTFLLVYYLPFDGHNTLSENLENVHVFHRNKGLEEHKCINNIIVCRIIALKKYYYRPMYVRACMCFCAYWYDVSLT